MIVELKAKITVDQKSVLFAAIEEDCRNWEKKAASGKYSGMKADIIEKRLNNLYGLRESLGMSGRPGSYAEYKAILATSPKAIREAKIAS